MTKTEQQLDYIWKQCGSPLRGDGAWCGDLSCELHGAIEIGLGHVFKKFESLGIKIGDVILSAHGTAVCTFMHNSNCTEFTGNGSFLIVHDNNGDFAKIRDQSPETIDAIAKLMGWKDE